jgi:hypothetical protein
MQNWKSRSRHMVAPLALACLLAAPGAGLGQDAPLHEELEPGAPAARDQAPLIFIDCTRCDFGYIRREIRFVNHVRDPTLAQVYVLITHQPTGSGGRTYTLSFEGRDRFQRMNYALQYTAHGVDTAAEERSGLTEMLKLGLAPYVARTPLAARVHLRFDENGSAVVEQPEDRWDSWSFEVYGGGNYSLEQAQTTVNARYGFFADRVTEEWKLRLRPYFNHNVRIVRRGGDEIRSIQRRHGFDSHVIRSVGPHWGAGVFAHYITNTFDNLRHSVVVMPAIEYSLFPYDESAIRQITLSYRIGYEMTDYFQETIYERTEEMLLNHAVNASVQFRQPWGSISSSLRGSNYLHDMNHYRITFNGYTSLRLVQGVSLNVGANFQRIHDQLALPRGEASLEDILLQRRQLATSYRSWGEVGLAYRFGSIYNNVVNPRL